jgi:hypothetical protein
MASRLGFGKLLHFSSPDEAARNPPNGAAIEAFSGSTPVSIVRLDFWVRPIISEQSSITVRAK